MCVYGIDCRALDSKQRREGIYTVNKDADGCDQSGNSNQAAGKKLSTRVNLEFNVD